jgi:serine/threonine protein phosphatase PrpC
MKCQGVALLAHILASSCVLQESYGGEDAFFVSNAGGGAMGVADGVGGWQESGVNPAGV